MRTQRRSAEPKQENRWFRHHGRSLPVLTFLFADAGLALALGTSGLPPSWTADYDRARYIQVRQAIEDDREHLLGRSFDDFSKQLRLEDVPWDDGLALQLPEGMYRIYHFQGFALHVTLEPLPAGVTPDRIGRSRCSDEERQRPRVLWFIDAPFVRIDGIGDRRERMTRHLKELDRICAEHNAEMERIRQSDGR